MIKRLLTLLAAISLIAFCSVRGCACIQFDKNCAGHLKLAADANTVERARSELDIALKYLENHRLTNEHTSIFYTTPDEDLSFWYGNLTDSREELAKISPETSQLERTNVLMKLRETILDDKGEHGTEVTAPAGIEIYPNNARFWWWGMVSGFLLLLFGGWWFLVSVGEISE